MSDSDSDPEYNMLLSDLVQNRHLGDENTADSDSDIHVSEGGTDFDPSESDSDDEPLANVRRQVGADGWSRQYREVTIPEFSSFSGTPQPSPMLNTPFDYFSQMIPLSFFSKLADETNLFARQKLAAKGVAEEAMPAKFPPTTSDEMRAYIGLLFYMNVAPLPSIKLYWAEDQPTYCPFVAQVMSRNRFESLAQYFHMNDSSKQIPRGQPGFDPLYKVRPIVSLTQETFSSSYHPSKDLTVDEAMIKFKGRCGFLQYLPAKPTKWGIKVWALCDAKCYYMLNYSIYTGKVNDLPDADRAPLGDRVVLHLTEPYFEKNHVVFFDNYFTSMSLLTHLYEASTLGTGTVRVNRSGLPNDMKDPKCVKASGDTVRWYKPLAAGGQVQAIAWYDRRKVTVLTTAHTNEDGEVTRKGPGGVVRSRYSRPLAIEDYNRGYNGVDKHDQMRSYYGSTLKFQKWWKYVLFFCLDTSAVNAFILYLKSPWRPAKPLDHLHFQLQIITGMINGYRGRKRTGRPLVNPLGDRHRHVPSKITTKRGKRDCTLCKQEGRKTASGQAIQTSFECTQCSVALCKDHGCFGKFHQE